MAALYIIRLGDFSGPGMVARGIGGIGKFDNLPNRGTMRAVG